MPSARSSLDTEFRGELRVGQNPRAVRIHRVRVPLKNGVHVLLLDDLGEEPGCGEWDGTPLGQRAIRDMLREMPRALMLMQVYAQVTLRSLEEKACEGKHETEGIRDIARIAQATREKLEGAWLNRRANAASGYLPRSGEPMDGKSGTAEALVRYSRILLEAFMTALEAHCPGSTGHARRTAEVCGVLAQRLGLDPQGCDDARQAGFFHDVGKIGIPDHILQNPGPLSQDERAIMGRHPEIGYDLLKGFPFLLPVADAAYAHHERLDGKGYPRKLQGPEIPRVARIVAVADAYDILRVGRIYQPAVSREKAARILAASAGTQFDPEVIAALTSPAPAWEKIHAEYL